MMDSQENALELGKNEVIKEEVTPQQAEEPIAENASQVATEEVSTPAEEPAEQPQKVYETKAEVLARIQEIAHGDEAPQKEEVDYLKTVFYKLHIAEREANLKAYIDAGGDPELYQISPDEKEEAFKAEMGIIKEKRAKIFKEQEAEKQENLTKKLDIIEKIKSMITTPEEANKSYQEFKALQQQWREIKNVPAEKANELWRNYQLYVEQFYDMLRLNSEAREYDFKKNLELKTGLCEAAEKLAEEEDVISAFHQLQKLHQEYREIGPVSKELREEIWNRFKAASTVINKRHQQHFEGIRAKEEENLARKTALCEKVEAIAAEENKGSGDWEKHTKAIIDIQAEWKTIGFAPQKMNVKIFERFRAACDDFFGRKAEYFKSLKDTFKENADKKRALIEKAKALQDSTEWKSTSDKLIALQKEWKTIGMVPKKLGDQLWEEFLGACNKFFEARNAAGAGQRGEEHTNLSKKREVIEKLKAVAEETGEDIQEKVQKLVEEYNAIGHVPYKEKDKIYEEYHAVLDKLYKELNISVAKRRLSNFKQTIKQVAERGENALDNERSRLFRQYEALKQEIQTYENNLGFLNASSKKGNSLIDEMNRKVQKLKDDMNLVKEKIKAIDAENKQ
ncbi:protein of unknown function [Prevotella aff. ruminicola Tc2-24]|uniref:DUF349 domain-containing protein n=1 Tax=Prevotella aff. ruminicola Tc2-24 TaxID=81582 RepID=A0A1I0PHT8_9BACT|nr:DUF349 domain-containing protein [Prevotella aff. ruminicola Tc2-24]SEW13986.1 protein of unknown function [Prevotella aff. ruminicola Tc2-24]